jgi:thioredoxin-related protein
VLTGGNVSYFLKGSIDPSNRTSIPNYGTVLHNDRPDLMDTLRTFCTPDKSHLVLCCLFFIILLLTTTYIIACAKFTPKLHLFNQLQGDDKEHFEIIFCSMDRSEEEYKKNAEQMPWWCLPYAMSTLPKLAAIYHAHGMPHLVIIDTDGKVITKNGVDELTQDPTGSHFPWRPIRIVDLLPEEYIVLENEEDEVVCPMTDLDEKYLMLYFSSKTCSYSQDFMPWLVKAYKIMKKKRPAEFEVRQEICTRCLIPVLHWLL